MIPLPSLQVAVLMASALVHADEALSPDGHDFDVTTFRDILNQDEVATYLRELDELALLPVKRS